MQLKYEIIGDKLKMECGCEFDIHEHKQPFPRLKKFNYNKLPDCKRVWEMLGQGIVKGVFQLESGLGKSWAVKVKPESMEHLSGLISVIRPGSLECISGDTKIKSSLRNIKNRGNRMNSINYTIRDLYNRYVNNHPSFKGKIVSFNEVTGELFDNKIVKMYSNGNKEVFKPIFRSRSRAYVDGKFYSLECTDNHKLLTYNRGWIELKNLEKGERVAILRHNQEHAKKYKDKLVFGEKNFRDICYYNYIYKCVFCDWKEGSLDVNHLTGNRKTDNSQENLCFLCPNHHRMYSEKTISKEQVLKEREQYELKQFKNIIWVEYSHKESLGIKDVYDIEVEGEFHNYLAGNVVVHNCHDEKGVSMTEHYAMRKNNLETVESIHPVVDNILKDTYNIICYQEQCIRLAVEIAGFSPSDADSLRKAIGTKDTQEMAKVETKFIEGVKRISVVSEEIGKKIFENIKFAQRYGFNKSHGWGYSTIGYQTAYVKLHFPLQFFRAWIAWAKEKMDREQELSDLVMDAKLFNIDVLPPRLEDFKADTYDDGRNLFLGLTEIKGVGGKVLNKIKDLIKEQNINILDLSIDELIIASPLFVGESILDKMIWAGALRKWSKDRKRNAIKLANYYQLSDGEQKWCIEFVKYNRGKTLEEVMDACAKKKKDGGGCHNDKRVSFVKDLVNIIKNSPTSLDDTPFGIYNAEQTSFGIPLTVSKVDTVDISDVSQTCKDFIEGKEKEYVLAVEIIDSRVIKVKRGPSSGKDMAYLSISDGTAKIDNVTIFSNVYEECKDLIEKGNVIIIKGYRQIKNNAVSFVVEKIFKKG